MTKPWESSATRSMELSRVTLPIDVSILFLFESVLSKLLRCHLNHSLLIWRVQNVSSVAHQLSNAAASKIHPNGALNIRVVHVWKKKQEVFSGCAETDVGWTFFSFSVNSALMTAGRARETDARRRKCQTTRTTQTRRNSICLMTNTRVKWNRSRFRSRQQWIDASRWFIENYSNEMNRCAQYW